MHEKPGQPGYTVETTRGNIDLQRKGWKHLDERADLHVVAVVKANSDHMENMVCKEGQKTATMASLTGMELVTVMRRLKARNDARTVAKAEK